MDIEELGMRLLEKLPAGVSKKVEGRQAGSYFESMRDKDKDEARRRYLGRKTGLIALAASFGMMMVLVSALKYNGPEEIGDVLDKPAYGKGSSREMLDFIWSTEEGAVEGELSVGIPERIPDDDEAAIVLESKEHELLTIMLGNNVAVDNISESLSFESMPFDNKNINVDWISNQPYLISSFGRVRNENLDKPADAVVRAVMTYGSATKEVEYHLVVMPKMLSSWERRQWLEENIREDESRVYLPVEEGKVSWMKSESGIRPLKVAGLAVFAVVMAALLSDREVKQQKEKRLEDMVKDLPTFMQMLSLLMRAGSTLPQAWKRLCNDYEKVKNDSGKRPLYEEALAVMASYDTGVPFSACLFEMNRYCNQMEVSRMTLLLIQNVKKGNKTATESMDRMNREIWKTHLELMKKQGELISTKLLLPMLMQLGIVLAIVLTPALLTMNP